MYLSGDNRSCFFEGLSRQPGNLFLQKAGNMIRSDHILYCSFSLKQHLHESAENSVWLKQNKKKWLNWILPGLLTLHSFLMTATEMWLKPRAQEILTTSQNSAEVKESVIENKIIYICKLTLNQLCIMQNLTASRQSHSLDIVKQLNIHTSKRKSKIRTYY